MKNRFLIILLTFFLNTFLSADELLIEAKNITLDKNKNTSIFKDNVTVKKAGKKITSQYAEFNKDAQTIILKDNIIAKDNFENIVKTNYAEFNNINDTLKTIGSTTFLSAKNYVLEGENIFFDNKNEIIKSDTTAILKDPSGNEIYLENFEYLVKENIFKSVGSVEIIDQFKNNYKFSQIYIDTKKKEIIGTDIKAFLNHEDFKTNIKNDPRIFANSMKSSEDESTFNKSVFTLCEDKNGDKCPPWSLQASKMTHNNKKKTIYYDNAVLKIYDIPIFYFPYLSHPDPSVDRRSGFLPPTFSDSKNLGAGVSVPYFWAVRNDKNLTITNKLFVDEHPLFLGEYHQALFNSNFLTDFGYTKGYKNTSDTKKSGNKSHFFSKFVKNYKGKLDSENTLKLITQNVSDNKYLKLYKIETNLVDYEKDVLENTLGFTHSSENLFFGFNASVYETLKDSYSDKYEYILPEITIDRNLINSEKFGNLNFQTNLEVHNYDTNKLTSFFINDLDWESEEVTLNSIIKSKFLGKLKNINYEAKNVDIYKEDTTNELFGAIGLLSEINFQKRNGDSIHLLTPKLLLRMSPGGMRKDEDSSRLNSSTAFNIDRVESIKNFETGNTATLGFDFNIKKENIDKFNFSVAQIINEKEDKKLGTSSGLDEKLSDLFGSASYSINKNLKFDYQFAVDQNYNEINYSDLNANLNLDNLKIDFNYIQEDKHVGNQEYFKTKVNYNIKDTGSLIFENKRNLITNSSEFYDLGYEYINDCLRAGLVFRREFYNDSEIEADNSLMFNITLVPFGTTNLPKINK